MNKSDCPSFFKKQTHFILHIVNTFNSKTPNVMWYWWSYILLHYLIKKKAIFKVAYICHNFSDNYIHMSDLYAELSYIYVDLSFIYLLENKS